MNTLRTATASAVAAALAAASLAMATAAPVQAAPAPKPAFLTAEELPVSHTPWTAGAVRPGTSEDFCYGSALPAGGSSHRAFRTELDTSAEQTVVVAPSAAAAERLVSSVRSRLDDCLERLKRKYPTMRGEERRHGRIDVEEGAYVYSLDTWHPEGATDIALYSVGRDGRTVTVVGWGRMGDFPDAPLEEFRRTARTSVAKLH
ncbi:hypothetical protein [Streptomyces clavuligerus]|uniref:Secreted protein n=1 Tax=Streptomyces clavuligerus TaxID=1901 RepID=E2PX62_STRCL|nr:hypothetical protein [Streptomyces clavuligerus]ANW17381.1 hypothetical protein BB341_03650 [Streptomyces clavuligerus]AXU11931.1 hypothetical protein D1794_03820 [Streptomyces clavuligerus]EFG10139.1 Hypothetical protein SCLAV_5066 [Streptomyces clavuligerus]MBY6301774.1 hypothetical protein [Streptomyces clavuligerus]QCS04711.1 hypothetical protein CRV15_03250 [Streptomyces clavuligerus]